ncbi:rab-GTPase-TBC domain-containing protein [Paraphysoderma sedebokerense]|nr:rab-GTPase-TBC domain-containing protein [Paraphysoderma sedebokerense]
MNESIDLESLNERDTYGFKKSNQHVTKQAYQDWEKSYKREIDKAESRWNGLLKQRKRKKKSGMPERSDKLKRLIRKGIPNRHRRKVWLHYSGAEQLMLANEGVYLSMLQREKDESAANGTENGPKKVNMAIDQIERDLHRTFPDNVHFQQMETVPPFTTSFPPPPYAYSTPLLHSLRRVLVAYSFYNPRLGYCQSLNYIVGLLLLFMPEEEAFWMLVSIIQNIMPDQMYSKNLRGTVTEMKVLTGVARTKCRDVLDKVKKGGMIELDALISPWFLTLFINILPIECVLRVWDCLYYEGNKILYRIALAVLKLNEDKIMKIKDPMEVVVHIQVYYPINKILPFAEFPSF